MTAVQASKFEPLYFDFPEGGKLSEEMVQYYKDHGFLILNGYLNPKQCDDLVAEGMRIIDNFFKTTDTIETFSGSQNVMVDSKRGDLFQSSVDKVVCLTEPGAVANGKLVVPKERAVNKIAHALGELSQPFRAVTLNNAMRMIAEQLGIPNPLLNQSMMMCKFPKIGGEVKPHHDSTFLYTEPNTTLAFWTPLQQTTLENACLQVIPGSHKWPILFRYVKYEDRTWGYEDLNGTKLTEERLEELMRQWDGHTFTPIPMDSGSLILFKGSLVHGSGANTSDKSRNAYTFHVISADSEYSAKNWLQRKEFVPVKSDD